MMLYIDGRLGASLAESAEHRDSDDEQDDKTRENEKSNVGENQTQEDESGNSRVSEDSEGSEELQELANFKPRKLGKRERKHTPYNPPSMQSKLIKQYKKDNIAEEYQTLISESESDDEIDSKEPENSKERDSNSVKIGRSKAVQDSEDSDHFHDCEDSHIDVLEEYLYSRSMDSSQYLPSSENSSSSAFPPTSSLSSLAIKTFKDRLADIPIYVANKDKIVSLYTNAKDSRFVGGVMNNAEEIARSYLPYSKIQSYDEGAAEILGKINEKFSILQQTPSRIADISKSTVTNTAVVCAQMVRNSSVFERFSRGLDGGVALCEIALEACLPTDLSDQQDLEELRGSHDDESISGNVIGNASSLVKRATSRGGKRLRCYSNSISSKLIGGNEQGPIVAEYDNFSENDVLLEIRNFRNWERVYSSKKMLSDQLNSTLANSVVLPNKIVAFTGECYVSAKEMASAYMNSRCVTNIHISMLDSSLRNDSCGCTTEEISRQMKNLSMYSLMQMKKYLDSCGLKRWLGDQMNGITSEEMSHHLKALSEYPVTKIRGAQSGLQLWLCGALDDLTSEEVSHRFQSISMYPVTKIKGYVGQSGLHLWLCGAIDDLTSTEVSRRFQSISMYPVTRIKGYVGQNGLRFWVSGAIDDIRNGEIRRQLESLYPVKKIKTILGQKKPDEEEEEDGPSY